MVEPNIPPAPEIEGARHLHSGKVRDLYELTEGPYAGQLLMVASDRISAFDYVLDTVIPDKGEILTRMSLWWFDQLAEIVPNHVLSTDVPESVKGRAVICQKLQMFPVECVARGYLTGSGLLDYQATGGTPEGPRVCGVHLPAGLVDGSRLTAIDFDDAGFGWHQYDIAVVLTYWQNKPNEAAVEHAFLAGYRAARPVPDEALALIPMFRLIRWMASIGWFHERPELEPSAVFEERKAWVLERCASLQRDSS